MPTSTQHGFLTGKWELKYLKCRFRAHRNKIAAAKPAIDSKMPPERPHVTFKVKKAVLEDRRQSQILAENFRILRKTAEIMGDGENVIHVSRQKLQTSQTAKSKSRRTVHFAIPGNINSPKLNNKEERSLTAITNRNYHIIHRWFQLKFGKYFPWWAQISY